MPTKSKLKKKPPPPPPAMFALHAPVIAFGSTADPPPVAKEGDEDDGKVAAEPRSPTENKDRLFLDSDSSSSDESDGVIPPKLVAYPSSSGGKKVHRAAAKSPGKVPSSRSKKGSGGDLKSPPEAIVATSRKRGADNDSKEMLSKRARMPSSAAVEAANNESLGMAIRAIRTIKNLITGGETTEAEKDKKEQAAKTKKIKAAFAKIKKTSTTKKAVEKTVIKRVTKVKATQPTPVVVKKEHTPAQVALIEKKRLKSWTEGMALLVELKNRTGACSTLNAPEGLVSIKLKNFIGDLRRNQKLFLKGKESTITAAKIKELEDMGFDFNPLESAEGKALRNVKHDQTWDKNFSLLEAYKAVFGNCLVTSMAGTDNKSLGYWVRGQRKLMNQVGREGFPPHRLAKLESIGFDFDPFSSGAIHAVKRERNFPASNAAWEKKFNKYKAFKETHPHVALGPTTKGFEKIYSWVHVQRKEYKRYQVVESSQMHPEWIEKMNSIDFDWAPMSGKGFQKMLQVRQKGIAEKIWQNKFKELMKFKKKYGHCDPASVRGIKDPLVKWVNNQRQHKTKHDNGYNTPINDERIQLLTDNGLEWNPSQDEKVHRRGGGQTEETKAANWNDIFQKLVLYQKQKGHCNPKTRDPLGAWTARQRSLYKKNEEGEVTSLSDERIAKLTSIGFVFEAE